MKHGQSTQPPPHLLRQEQNNFCKKGLFIASFFSMSRLSFHSYPEVFMIFLFLLLLFTAPLCLSAIDDFDSKKTIKISPLKEAKIDAENDIENEKKIALVDAILKARMDAMIDAQEEAARDRFFIEKKFYEEAKKAEDYSYTTDETIFGMY